jgi:transglutaminase-like putative cysteine protease
MRLQISHITVYRYSEPVFFGPHRLMVRPREGHDLTIESSRLEIFPAHRLRWSHDALGNSVASVDFTQSSDELRVYSEVVVKHFESNPFNFILESYATNYPFQYTPMEFPDLAPFLKSQWPEEEGTVREWLSKFFTPGRSMPTVDLLMEMNQAIRQNFVYNQREEPGVQSPAETLRIRGGSCRDYATLFMEACRHLGLAGRFVSGYLNMPEAQSQHGSTHAWTEVYLPGAGWKGFDPTGGIMACDLHVPVAVARRPEDAAPVSGTFSAPGYAMSMQVSVHVQELL